MHLLKIRKLSRTCISCLLDSTEDTFIKLRSVNGCSVCSHWYESVGLDREDRLMTGTIKERKGNT